jgi:hypothetical protein
MLCSMHCDGVLLQLSNVGSRRHTVLLMLFVLPCVPSCPHRRYLDRVGETKYLMALKNLCDAGEELGGEGLGAAATKLRYCSQIDTVVGC